MTNNGKAPQLLRPQSASKIFDFFKETASYDVVGPGGEKLPVLFRTLDYGQNAALVKDMDLVRASIKQEMLADDLRGSLIDQAVRFTREKLVEAILDLERPLAEEQADLAPGAAPEAVEAAEKEKEAVRKWEASRRSELDGLDDKDLRSRMVDRQTRLLLNGRLLGEFMNASLVYMVLDPESREPMFSFDVFYCAQCGKRSRDLSTTAQPCCGQPMDPVPNFIGRLSTEIRDQLVDFRRQFTVRKDEKAIRRVADSPSFLPSGASPAPAAASPGATAETP